MAEEVEFHYQFKTKIQREIKIKKYIKNKNSVRKNLFNMLKCNCKDEECDTILVTQGDERMRYQGDHDWND